MTPRASRVSGTWHGVLIDDRVHVLAEAVGIDPRRPAESGNRGIGVHELPAAKRQQLADRRPVAGDDEGLPPIEGAHDLAAAVAQLALGDAMLHERSVAPVLHHLRPCLNGDTRVTIARSELREENLHDVDDMASQHGLSETQEARFPRADLGAEQTGMNYLVVKPGQREAFAHRHRTAEEIYVVLGGSGRVKLDDELYSLRRSTRSA